MSDFYQLEAVNVKGEKVKMENYKGKTLLIVNTATKCGLTPQLNGLEELNKKYKDQGLEILGFPCNQFANQEPGNNKEIAETCSINYGVNFTLFEKSDVNGKNTNPVFKYLKNKLGGWFTNDIKWNFTKFVVDKNGNPIKRFSPITKPEEIEKFLKQKKLI
jgi:glutathione peroxidase